MIIGLIGSRGTVPTSRTATVSFIVDNRFLFECPSEIIQAFDHFQKKWIEKSSFSNDSEIMTLGKPTLGRIKYIILSHLHFDHWGGLAHIMHRIMLLEKEMRQNDPLKLIIPQFSTIPFQIRLNQTFLGSILSNPLTDDEFLYRFLSIEVGPSIKDVLKIIVLKSGEILTLDEDYTLTGIKNNHLELGSFSYKLQFKKTKLDIKKAKTLGIPFNKTLKKIEKSLKPIKVGKLNVSRNQIFFDIITTLCYSGDTQLDPNLFTFFNDCHILLHEATYLTPEENFHLESHSDVQSLVKEVEKISDLKAFVPIHFSIRYKEEEISQFLNTFSPTKYQIVNPLTCLLIQIEAQSQIKLIKR